ncbi:MAG: peptidoglycan binding protein CsiV [Gammaproteobacteria bacterium]|nr:peptidoglycan binding protein CsiV [Gammaproteobacteria bacterium]MDH3434859.1 peptidoglycan binding protein CsiV [Gammaproteobacteria bacterium]
MKKTGTFLIFVMCLATAVAQDNRLEELPEEEARRYTVEIIIFSYEEDVSVGTEVFLPDRPPVEPDLLSDDETMATLDEPRASGVEPIDDGQDDAGPEIRELEFVMLEEDEFTLDKIARQFELLDVYATIMHVGWTQPTYAEEETPPLELRVLGDPPQGLDGTFKLYLSRYLHLVVDLALDASENSRQPVDVDGSFFRFGDSRTRDDNFGSATQSLRYRIQENRILKNGELRYFDHPKFGVLAKVTRVEEDEENKTPGSLVPGTGQ